MSITINRRANVDGDKLYEYDLKGLSTDTKPTQIGGQDIEDNSLFLELDTGDFYYFANGSWTKIGEAPTPPTPTGLLIEDTISKIFEGEDFLVTSTKTVTDYYNALVPVMTNVEGDTHYTPEGFSATLKIKDVEYTIDSISGTLSGSGNLAYEISIHTTMNITFTYGGADANGKLEGAFDWHDWSEGDKIEIFI